MTSPAREDPVGARIVFAKRTSIVVDGVDARHLCEQLTASGRGQVSFLPVETDEGVLWVNAGSVLYVADVPARRRRTNIVASDSLEWAPGFRP